MSEKVRTELADELDSQARWREIKAEEYPDDARNRRSADGLYELAQTVRDMPDDHPVLLAWAKLCEVTGLSVGEIMPMEAEISRFRFNDPHQSGDEFLKDVASTAFRSYEDANDN